ncbi:MAG: hypothetical protein AAF702_07695 [Chloroflexota bacterium]
MSKLLTTLALGAALIIMVGCGTGQTDAARIEAAVQATLAAQPTVAPQLIEVTRIVEVTVAPSGVDVPTSNEEPTQADANTESNTDADNAEPISDTSNDGASNDAGAESSEETGNAAPQPIAINPQTGCPDASNNQYSLIPMEAVDTNHPDELHGDLNLALRGYEPTDKSLDLVFLGAVGEDPPQMSGLFADQRLPVLTAAYQVRDWDWGCGDHGCPKDEFVDSAEVTAVAVATNPGEIVNFPSTESEIIGGGYIAAVLYAAPSRLTLGYTRDGSVAGGYTVHLENFCVDPNLMTLYRASNATGRTQLPGLLKGESVGVAGSTEMIVAIRIRGSFMDPRSEGDWWR